MLGDSPRSAGSSPSASAVAMQAASATSPRSSSTSAPLKLQCAARTREVPVETSAQAAIVGIFAIMRWLAIFRCTGSVMSVES